MSKVYGDEKRWWAFACKLRNALIWYELKPRSFALLDIRRVGDIARPWLTLSRHEVRELVTGLQEWLATTEDRPT